MTKRAVLYARVSSQKQEKGYSLESQVESCRKLAASNNWVVTATFREVCSGTVLNRPQLDKLRDLVAAGEVDVVVVHDVDRLGRDPAQIALVERELEESGCSISYVLLPDADSPSGQLLKDVKAAVGRFENLQRVERSRRGARRKAKEGKVIVGPHRPYGYRVDDDGRLKIDPEEADVVRDIFRWLVEGGTTLSEITRRLEGIPTKNDKTGVYPKKRGYGVWARSSVRCILTNETYVGSWFYGKNRSTGRKGTRGDRAKEDYILCDPQPREAWIEVEVPAIISQRVFDAAQEMLARNKRMARRNSKRKYLLGSLIYCECGRAMCGASYETDGKRYKYYQCSARTEYATAGPRCDAYRIRVDEADKAVWEYIRDLLEHPDCLALGLEEQRREAEEGIEQLEARLDRIDGQIAECDRKLDRLLEDSLADRFGQEVVDRKAQKLTKHRAKLEAQRNDFEERIQGALARDLAVESARQFAAKISSLTDNADFEQKRKVMKLLAVRIDCDKHPTDDGRRIIVSGNIPQAEIVVTKASRSCTTRSRR